MILLYKCRIKGWVKFDAVILEENITHTIRGEVYHDGILYWIPRFNRFEFGMHAQGVITGKYRYIAYADDTQEYSYWGV